MLQKTFDKVHHLFTIKILDEVGIEGAQFNIIKATCENPTANIILNRQKLKASPLRQGTRRRCPLLPFLFNIVLDMHDGAEIARERGKYKGIKW